MFNLIIILTAFLNSEVYGSNNYKIAKYIIENVDSLEDCSISELASRCYVSNSSVSRFCRDIGLRDFSDLKNQVSKYQVLRDTASQKFDYKRGKDNDDKSYIDYIINNLNLLKNSLDYRAVNELVRDIYHYEHVAAFGYMQSENIALNLQYDLQTKRKFVYTCLKYADQIDYIKNADETHLIIIFSDSATYFKRAFLRNHPFKNMSKKPKIYVLTSDYNSNLPYVDRYIRYKSFNDYASHPYALLTISGLICTGYCELVEQGDKPE